MPFQSCSRKKIGNKITESSRLGFLEKSLANNFDLPDVEDNTSKSLNRGGIADLPLFRKILPLCQRSLEPSFLEVMVSFFLLAYASLAATKTLLQQLLACLNFTLDSKDLFVQIRRVMAQPMAATQAAKNHGDEWGLTSYSWEIYTSIPTWNHSQHSLAAAEELNLKISSEASLKWSQRPSQSA